MSAIDRLDKSVRALTKAVNRNTAQRMESEAEGGGQESEEPLVSN